MHPKDQSLKIFVYIDVPHLLKLVKNHFLDNGFIINGKCINKECIEEILQLQEDKDLKIVHRISKNNLEVSGANRQKVRTAAKLFSKSTARAIAWYHEQNFLKSKNCIETAKFLEQIND